MTDPSAPRLLAIVLNYRTPEMTLRSVRAALADLPSGGELIIVDNASDDGSARMLEQAIADNGWHDRVRLIVSDVNGGFGAGNNIGIRAGMSDGGPADFVYIVNSDAFADTGCIPTLLDHLLTHPNAGIAGSHVRGEDGVPHTTAFRFPSICGEFEGAARIGLVSRLLPGSVVAPPLPDTATRVDWVAGASVMLRGAMLARIGHFDETFFLYFEETDLCRRAARDDWACWYVPEARVVHIGSVSTGMKEWPRMPDYWFASRRHYFVKNHGRAYAAAAFVARALGAGVHALRCRITGRASQDRAHFLGDFLRHGLGLTRGALPAISSRTASKDRP